MINHGDCNVLKSSISQGCEVVSNKNKIIKIKIRGNKRQACEDDENSGSCNMT